MSLPSWMPLLFVVWALVLVSMYALVSRWDGARRTAARKVVLFTIAGSLVAAVGIVTLYARAHAVSTNPAAANKPASDCDKPPAPAPAPPPATPSKSDTASKAAAPNFLTFAACSDGAKPPTPAKR